jgi:hypothetical protein
VSEVSHEKLGGGLEILEFFFRAIGNCKVIRLSKFQSVYWIDIETEQEQTSATDFLRAGWRKVGAWVGGHNFMFMRRG